MELDHFNISSAGISEAGVCLKSCVWRRIRILVTLETSVQGHRFSGNKHPISLICLCQLSKIHLYLYIKFTAVV